MKSAIQSVWSYLVTDYITAGDRFVFWGLFLFVIVFGLGCLVSLVIALLRRRKKTLCVAGWIPSVASIGRYGGGLGLIFHFLAYEGLSPFTKRWWSYAVLIGMIAALVVVFRRWLKSRAQLDKLQLVNDHYARYLPKPKGKKR